MPGDIDKVEELTKVLKHKQTKADTVLAFLETPEILEKIVDAAMLSARECALAEKFVDLTVEYETSPTGSAAESQSKEALIGVRKRIQAAAEAASVVAVDAVVQASGVIATCSADMAKTKNSGNDALIELAEGVIEAEKKLHLTPDTAEDVNAKTRDEILREIPGGAA